MIILGISPNLSTGYGRRFVSKKGALIIEKEKMATFPKSVNRSYTRQTYEKENIYHEYTLHSKRRRDVV